MNSKATVYIIDDELSIRKSLARLLKSAQFTVQTFETANEFLATKPDSGPGCLILDLHLPGTTGLELQTALAKIERSLPIIFISGHADIPASVTAMKAGAIDFLSKPFDDKVLLEAVERALARDVVLRREQSQRRTIGHRRERLTSREGEVFTLVVGGHLNKQIALKLGISEKTVKVHRARVMEKMRAGSLAELVHLDERIRALF